MRCLVHMSDLHFGRVDEGLVAPLLAAVRRLQPDIVAVSGDLTQRARKGQFLAARRFLDQLPTPLIVVPGNHDVPATNLFERVFARLSRYRRYITPELAPFYADAEVAILGLNTARSFVIKGGSINPRQLAAMRRRLCGVPEDVVKIIVTHHPFDLPEDFQDWQLVRNSRTAMTVFASCGADVFLSGHMHVTRTLHSHERYRIPGHSALVVHAGTAISTRHRGETNSFNELVLRSDRIQIRRHVWDLLRKDFLPEQGVEFRHSVDGWRPVSEGDTALSPTNSSSQKRPACEMRRHDGKI